MTATGLIEVHLDALIADALDAGELDRRGRLEWLKRIDDRLVACRVTLWDARARIIAEAAAATSTRQAAVDLGLSPSAVAKAVARARASERAG